MELEIRKLDEIWTRDGELLGQVHHVCQRTNGVDPVRQLYRTYLHVVSYESGDDYYVPTDFIAGYEPDTGRLLLTVSMAEVLKRTWTRLPDFILAGEAEEQPLPFRYRAASGPAQAPRGIRARLALRGA